MRYTTQRFGEVVYLLGEFAAGQTLGAVTIEIFDLETDTSIALDDNVCSEVTGSVAGTFASYVWANSNITTPTTLSKQYLYIMTDGVRVQKGKYTVGGFPDESARARYGRQIHITADGAPLATLGTVGPESLTFATGTPDTISRATPWPAAFAVGRRVQISGTASNDGVTTEIVSLSGAGPYLLNFAAGLGLLHGAFSAETVSTTAVVKSALYGGDEGTDDNPVLDIRDARQIAADLGYHEYHVHNGAVLTVDFPHDYWVWVGNDQDLDTLDFVTGSSNEGARFSKLWITGALNGRIVADNCIIGSTSITGVKGTFTSCAFKGTIVVGGDMIGDRCASRSSFATGIDNTGNHSFLMGAVQGVFTITGMTGGTVGMSIAGAIVQLHPTVTGGIVTAIGLGEFLYDSPSPVGLTVVDYVLRGSHMIQTTNSTVATGLVDIRDGVAQQWRETRYRYSGGVSDTVINEHYLLFDQDGDPIYGDHTAGNNPLFDPTRLIAERRR